MNTIQRTKDFIIIAFLLSLLFHTSSVFYVVWQGNNNNPAQSLQEKEKILKQKLQNKEEWVEGKARAGNFGAPVLFQDEPESTNTQLWEETTEDTFEPDMSENISNDEPSIIQEAIQSSSAKATKDRQANKHPSPSKPSRKKAHKKIRKAQSQQQTNPFSVPPKPPLSLAQLTQGFLHHIKNEGTNAMHTLGKKTGIKSDEQIKHERYIQKITWCLQNSFNINKAHFPALITQDHMTALNIAINRDGSLQSCQIIQPSGNPLFDKFILLLFRDASSSFPPVPHYLPQNPFSFNYVIGVNITNESAIKIYRG